MNKYEKDLEKINKLNDLQFKVTQKNGTEPPFKNEFWDNKQAGLYVDIVSGEPLFASIHKYDSGTGWPSFYDVIDKDNVVEKEDRKLFVKRTEVRSKHGDSHLGHVFPDGPPPTGLRYCVNSASLRFIPVSELESQGYGNLKPIFNQNQKATLAGGCFWGVEELFKELPGVTDTTVGYTGGEMKNPRYEDVKTGTTDHAEAIEIEFNPQLISYADLLRFFFRIHDPTTLNRQGNDIGSQYRSAIFYHSEEQRSCAEEIKKEVDQSGKWKKPVITQIVPAKEFYSAEEYHQDYLRKNPGGYTCHFIRD